jgi:uncharacterized membrane protein YraQ (UPF0718 family)
MIKWLHSQLVEITGLVIIVAVLYIALAGGNIREGLLSDNFSLPASVLSLNTIFLSIIIEAVPFVLIGVIIAGMIQIFITEDHIRRWMPKNRFMAVIVSCIIGAFFPACECGIVPIVRRLISKGVPVYAGIGFMLTGPLINPIVIFSTYMAFGNDFKMAILRMVTGFFVAIVVSLIVSMLFKGTQLKNSFTTQSVSVTSVKLPFSVRMGQMLRHSIDEFFDMGKYLILGAFFAALVQTYISSKTILAIGEGVGSSTLVMMGLAYLLSLCSEADAFIAASFRNLFPATALLGFLVFGPMIDLKNTLMMLGVFKFRFVFILILLIAATIFGTLMAVHGWL